MAITPAPWNPAAAWPAAQRWYIAEADEAAAALLKVALGVPLLSVDRVAFTYGEKPVEVRRALYVTAQHHYQNELS